MLSVARDVSRREWLRLGGLGTAGLSLPGLWAGQSVAEGPAESSFGRAKACIVLFMFGAPAHQDTFDLKPSAPKEVRGEFTSIESNVPGIPVVEHLPLLARQMDRFAQIRSVTHPDNTHTVAMHAMLTGVRHARPATNPQNAPDDFPCYGAVVNHLAGRGALPGDVARAVNAGTRLSIPAISLNSPANQVSANNHIFPGFFAGWLGNGHDPLFVPQNADAADFRPLPVVEQPARLLARRQLLSALETDRSRGSQKSISVEADYTRAFDLLTSTTTRGAFDLAQEPAALCERYGRTPFGQGCLLARRLVERGVTLVTVNWERDDAYWDTHKNNFIDLKSKLLPNMDRGMSALLDDLEQRGLLDETLIVWLGEFGRTPQINGAAGRDHWAACNTVLLAGAGVRGGTVYGASDRIAAYPAHHPVQPQDLSATLYHLLGIPPDQMLTDPQGRQLPLTTGEVVWDVL